MDKASLLDALKPVARQAGAAIRRHYQQPVDITRKEDGSPTTIADAEAEAIIVAALRSLTPTIPIVAEEAVAAGDIPPLPDGASFWLIDPLDGTKEFLKQTGEFTVNIGLIEQHQPVLGLVYVPVTNVLYYGAVGIGAYKEDTSGITPLHATPPPDLPFTVMASRSHHDGALLQTLLPAGKPYAERRVGSSLKFCLLAEGAAHLYARAGTTMEWDTAAGDALVRAAGGLVLDIQGQPLAYQKAGFINGSFVGRPAA